MEVSIAELTKLKSELLHELGKLQTKNQQLESWFKDLEKSVHHFRMDIENRFKKDIHKLEQKVITALDVNRTTLGKVSFLESSFKDVEGEMLDMVTQVEKMLEPFVKTLEKSTKGIKSLRK